MTNRELYTFVRGFGDKFAGDGLPSLEEYLCSLWLLVSPSRDASPSIEQLAGWLEAAFATKPPPFDPGWLNQRCEYHEGPATYEDWESLILFQIADLRRMAEASLLEDRYRYFGITSPSGSRWYNFDPLTYLECAVRGQYGGYEEAEVIVLVPPPAGESADDLVCEINSFGWADFIGLLECGQGYE